MCGFRHTVSHRCELHGSALGDRRHAGVYIYNEIAEVASLARRPTHAPAPRQADAVLQVRPLWCAHASPDPRRSIRYTASCGKRDQCARHRREDRRLLRSVVPDVATRASCCCVRRSRLGLMSWKRQVRRTRGPAGLESEISSSDGQFTAGVSSSWAAMGSMLSSIRN
jgi:hypothetical protein